MLRRQFIAGAATFALSARPLRTHAQSGTGRTRIGVLIYGTLENNPSTRALLEGFEVQVSKVFAAGAGKS